MCAFSVHFYCILFTDGGLAYFFMIRRKFLSQIWKFWCCMFSCGSENLMWKEGKKINFSQRPLPFTTITTESSVRVVSGLIMPQNPGTTSDSPIPKDPLQSPRISSRDLIPTSRNSTEATHETRNFVASVGPPFSLSLFPQLVLCTCRSLIIAACGFPDASLRFLSLSLGVFERS